MATVFTLDVVMEKLSAKLDSIDIEGLSRETGFVQRQCRKAGPREFVLGVFSAMFRHEVSLMSLAFSIGLFIQDTLSKNAVKKRLKQGFVTLLNRILGLVLSDHLKTEASLMGGKLFAAFHRVLLQDSTTIALPPKLAQFFPGSGTSTGKACATLKIQLIYEALRERFISFRIGSFRDNDQGASPLILPLLQPGDLVIRDLGYFVLEVFAHIHQQGACFLSRLQYGINLYCSEGHQEIDLVKTLKKHLRKCGKSIPPLDIDIRLGSKAQLPLRLVAIALPEEIANERRRKARQDRDRRANHSEDYFYLLGFALFVTNVDRQTWTAQQVGQAYQIRWRIEIIFKSWKSHFHITQVPNASVYSVQAYIYAMLIYITLVQWGLFIPLYQLLNTNTQQSEHLSLMKVAKLVNLIQSHPTVTNDLNEEVLTKQILYHCRYEKRKKRLSYPQLVAR